MLQVACMCFSRRIEFGLDFSMTHTQTLFWATKKNTLSRPSKNNRNGEETSNCHTCRSISSALIIENYIELHGAHGVFICKKPLDGMAVWSSQAKFLLLACCKDATWGGGPNFPTKKPNCETTIPSKENSPSETPWPFVWGSQKCCWKRCCSFIPSGFQPPKTSDFP